MSNEHNIRVKINKEDFIKKLGIKDGRTPTNEDILALIKPLIPEIPELPTFPEFVPETAEEIAKKLNTLNKKLDWSVLKNIPDFFGRKAGIGGPNNSDTIFYDNSNSTLEAVNVQVAIDELDINSLSRISTGLTFGGELSINATDNTKFDIAAGSGYVVDSHTDPANPIATKVTWDAFIGLTAPFLNTTPISFPSIDINGAVVQSIFAPVQDDRRDFIVLGVIVHDTPFIRKTATVPAWNQDGLNRDIDFYFSLTSVINISGNIISSNGANQKFDRSAGEFFGVGFNYDNDKKSPNIVIEAADTAITFSLGFRSPPVSTFVSATDIPTDKFDPNGDGTLVNLTTDFFVAHRAYFDPATEVSFIQYGQEEYDSLKRASNSYDKEDFERLPELVNLPAIGTVIVKQGVTDLSDPEDAKFISYGKLGDTVFSKIPSFARFAEPIELIDGMSYQEPVVTFVNDGGTIFADVESDVAGDITYVFGQRDFVLDATTGAGVSGKARVALTAGTAAVPVKNWIYTTRNGDDFATLISATTEPAGEHAMVATIILPDTTSFDNDDSYGSKLWDNAKAVDGVGATASILKKIRALPNDYLSGLAPVLSINAVPNPDEVDFTVASGIVRDIYDQTTDALQLSVDGALVVNDEVTAFTEIMDLTTITTDTAGNTLQQNNTYYQILVAISTNTDGKTRLLINKPAGSYTTAQEAFDDTSGHTVTTFPDDFKTVSLVCAFVIRFQSTGSGTYTNAASAFGVNFIDLRGQAPGASSQGSGSAAVTEFSDGAFKVFNSVDATKIVDLDVSNVTTGNTRTLSIPDRDGEIALTGKGSDIASATDITLGDGSYFDITGTTQIDTIASTNRIAGTPVILQFDASVTVAHNTAGVGASILLAGAANFSATANDTLTIVFDGVTWRETSRTVI